jgi:hypothetical protein
VRINSSSTNLSINIASEYIRIQIPAYTRGNIIEERNHTKIHGEAFSPRKATISFSETYVTQLKKNNTTRQNTVFPLVIHLVQVTFAILQLFFSIVFIFFSA